MEKFFEKVEITHNSRMETDSIILVDRYVRELRSFLIYKPVDKVSSRELSKIELNRIKEEIDLCEKWVDENQHKLTGL